MNVAGLFSFVVCVTTLMIKEVTATYFGKCLTGHTFIRFHSIALDDCVTKCVQRSECTSINYVRRFHECQLNNQAYATENEALFNVTTCPGHVYVIVRVNNVVTSSVTEPCVFASCHTGERCVTTGINYQCVVSECVGPLSVTNGVILGNMIRVGDCRRIECETGFILYGPDVIHCEVSGQWSEVGVCAQNCGVPSSVPNATVSYAVIQSYYSNVTTNDLQTTYGHSHYFNNSYIEYQCNANFQFVAENYTLCVNGVWTMIPQCDEVVAGLGQACTVSNECTAPDSECRYDICQCKSGLSYAYDRHECVSECVTFAETFQYEIDKKLNFLDHRTYYSLTTEECKQKCLISNNNCKSFELSSALCNIAIEDANDGGLYRDASGFTYYQRDCLTS